MNELRADFCRIQRGLELVHSPKTVVYGEQTLNCTAGFSIGGFLEDVEESALPQRLNGDR